MALDRFDTDFQRWEKTPGSPVCELDIAIDRMLKARLSTLLPEAGWLSWCDPGSVVIRHVKNPSGISVLWAWSHSIHV